NPVGTWSVIFNQHALQQGITKVVKHDSGSISADLDAKWFDATKRCRAAGKPSGQPTGQRVTGTIRSANADRQQVDRGAHSIRELLPRETPIRRSADDWTERIDLRESRPAYCHTRSRIDRNPTPR